jgi:hypothetical protein
VTYESEISLMNILQGTETKFEDLRYGFQIGFTKSEGTVGSIRASCAIGLGFRSHGLPQSLQENAKIVPQIRQRSFPSTSFVIH